MNDRFKFRFLNEYSNKLESCDEYDLKDIFESGNPVMQCTGLKDKNGKLIYEGDIVRFEETYECACFTNIKEVLFKIVWSDYSFKAKQIKIIQGNKSYEFPLTLSKLLEIEPYTEYQTTINLEIIGNIYENKDLLEEE